MRAVITRFHIHPLFCKPKSPFILWVGFFLCKTTEKSSTLEKRLGKIFALKYKGHLASPFTILRKFCSACFKTYVVLMKEDMLSKWNRFVSGKLISPTYPKFPVLRWPKAPSSFDNKGVHLPRLKEALNEVAENLFLLRTLTKIYLVGLTMSVYCSILKVGSLTG